jgi:hypothetical protein
MKAAGSLGSAADQVVQQTVHVGVADVVVVGDGVTLHVRCRILDFRRAEQDASACEA